MKKTTTTKNKSARYARKDQGEEFAIIDTKTGKTVAIVPYKPFGAARRELYRDRLNETEAALISDKLATALNS